MKKFHHYKQGSVACASTSRNETQEVIRLRDPFKLMKVDHCVEMPSGHVQTLFPYYLDYTGNNPPLFV